MQLFGHKNAEIAKRVDIAATAIYHAMTVDAVSDLDLSYTPPLGSPWDDAGEEVPGDFVELRSLMGQQWWRMSRSGNGRSSGGTDSRSH